MKCIVVIVGLFDDDYFGGYSGVVGFNYCGGVCGLVIRIVGYVWWCWGFVEGKYIFVEVFMC